MAIPNDAYPRVVAGEANIATSGLLRLQRINDEVICWGQRVEREPEVELWRGQIKLPRKVYVGLLAPTNAKDKGKVATFSGVKLNNKLVEQWQLKDLGTVSQPGTISRQGDAWTLSAAGKAKEDPQEMPGTYAYVQCEGDFELRAKVVSVEGEAEPLFAGLLCRSGLGVEDVMIGPMTRKGWSGVLCRLTGWKTHCWGRDWSGHLLALDLLTGPNQKKLILVRSVSPSNWDELKSQVEDTAPIIIRELTKALKLPVNQPRASLAATPQQLEALKAARQEAMRLAPDRVLAAARKVDAVLDQSPTCAEAHATAALCGAMLACQNLFGTFDRRDHVLSGPIAHLMLANRLYAWQAGAGAPSAQWKLTEVWLMLAAGYPDAALAAAQSPEPVAADSAEVKALRMFVTRDYRPLSEEAVGKAEPIEQLAWVWAIQLCGRADLMQEAPTGMAVRARSAALLPVYTSETVDAGHVNSLCMIALVFHADVMALLQCEQIPLPQRMNAAQNLAAALGINAAGDLPKLQETIASKLLGQGPGDEPYAAVAALTQLYSSVRGLPVGPMVDAQGPRWQTISLPEFVEVERGMLLLALTRRANFVYSKWGVPAAAATFVAGLSKSIRDADG